MPSGKIYILPMGAVPQGVLERLTERLTETFKRDIIVMEEVPLPLHCSERGGGQWNSTKILEGLAAMGLRDKTIGVIDLDLYVPGLNFVFGEADPGSGVCVISLTRLRQEFYGRAPDEGLFLRRAVKEAVHELGHLYGLPHCPDRRCVMYFSNSLPDTDTKTRRFCEDCKKAVTGK